MPWNPKHRSLAWRNKAIAALLAFLALGCGEPDGRSTPESNAPPLQMGAPADDGGADVVVVRSKLEEIPLIHLKATRVFGDTTALGRIDRIALAGDHLIVSDGLMSPHIVVVDRRTGQILQRLGRHGRGPFELLSPSHLQVTWQPDHDPFLSVFDFGNQKVIHYARTRGKWSEISERPLRLDLSVERLVPWKNGWVASGPFLDATLMTIDTVSRTVRPIVGSLPFTRDDVPSITALRLLNRGYVDRHPSRPELVYSRQWVPRVEFFDRDGSLRVISYGPREASVSYELRNGRFLISPDAVESYLPPAATDRYAYVPFCGCRSGDDEAQLPRTIHVFDWESKRVVREIALDHGIVMIAVSPDDQRLYGAIMDEYPRIAEWDIAD